MQQADDGNGGFGMKDMEDELRVLEDKLDAEDVDELFCVACNKEMRNEKAFASHRKQKKHLENVERLRETLLNDELISSDELKDDSDAESEKIEHVTVDEINNSIDINSEQLEEDNKEVTKNISSKRKTKCKRKKPNKNTSKISDVNTDLGCAVCKKEYPSKNKLFAHLKESGHSIALS